jgi:hypothetical protein
MKEDIKPITARPTAQVVQPIPRAEDSFAASKFTPPTPAVEPLNASNKPATPVVSVPEDQPIIMPNDNLIDFSLDEPQQPEVAKKASKYLRSMKLAGFFIITAAVLTVVIYALLTSNSHRQANYAGQVNSIPSQSVSITGTTPIETSPVQLQNAADTLIVNGDIAVRGSIKIYGAQYYSGLITGGLTNNQTYTLPNGSGTFCLDSNNCNFATDAQLAQIQGLNNIQGGSGISIKGRIISNSGVLTTNGLSGNINFSGTANQVSLSISGGNITLSLPQSIGTASSPHFQSISLIAEGTQNGSTICDSSNNCGYATSVGSGTGDVNQGGNSYGATMTMGTNDNFGLDLKTNNATVASLSNTGQATFQNSANSATAFRVQNALGTNLILVDTSASTVTIVGLQGSGANLTSLNASNIASGSLADARLSANVTLAGNTFNGASQLVQLNGSSQLPVASGVNLTSLNATNLASGTVADVRLSSNVTLQGNTFNGASQLVQLNGSMALPAVSGVNLTALNGSNISSGTVADARLTTNVTLQGNVFNSSNELVQLNGSGQYPALSGVNITNLNATNLASGTVNDSLLSTNVALLNGSQTFTGTDGFSNVITAPGLQPSGATLTVGTTTSTLHLQGDISSSLSIANSGHTVTLDFSGVPSGNVTYHFDTATTPGTYTICTTIGNCAGTGGGVTTLGGTTNKLAKYTGSASIGDSSISDNGTTVTVQPTANSTNSFQIQNTAGTSNLLIADTTNTRIAIGQASATYTLDVAGDINSTTGLRVGGNLVCTSTGCSASSSSGFYIQNGTSEQTSANFNIRSGNSASVGGIIRGAAGQTADLFQLKDASNNTVASVSSTGDVNTTGTYKVSGSQIASSNLSDSANLAKLSGTGPQTFTGNNKFTGTLVSENASDSTAAFSVQNALGSSVLAVDTSNAQIALGQSNSLTGKIVFEGAGGINSVSIVGVANPSANHVLTLPDETGTLCSTASVCTGYAPSGGSSSYVQLQGTTPGTAQTGNFNIDGTAIAASFSGSGSALTSLNGSNISSGTVSDSRLSTNVAFKNATQTFSGNNTFSGTVTAQNASNSTTAFQIQNTAGTSNLFVADTTNTRIAIGQASANYTLDVNGDVNIASGSVYRVNGASINTAGTLNNVAYLNGTGPQTFSGNNKFTGTVLAENTSDSVSAFQVQNAAGNELLRVDTSGGHLALGKASTLTTDLVFYNAGGSGSITLQGSNPGINNYAITLPNASGTVCLTSGNCAGVGGMGDILNNGNSFGSAVALGTNDNFGLNLETNNTTVASFTNSGAALFKNASNSTTAFQVQNVTGGQLFNIDTSGGNITLNGLNSGETGVWQTNANALLNARVESPSVVANGYVYAIGGYGTDGGSGAKSTVYYAKLNADGSTGTWQTNANALPAERDSPSSVVANGYVYAIGGNGAGYVTASTVYYAKLNADGSTGTWQTNANALPNVRYGHTSVVANGYVYVIGGRDGASQPTVYYAKLNADGSTGAWSTNANALPDARVYHSSVVANGYVYVIGGWGGDANAQSTVYYAKLNADGSTGTWQTNANALPDTHADHSSVVANGYIYVIGGFNGSNMQSTVYYAKLNADGSTGAWSSNANALPMARGRLSSVFANGYVYAIGGQDGSYSAQSTVYYASTSRIQMAGSLDLVSLSGQNLSDDNGTGGGLTAGNTKIVGSLEVQGQSSFAQSVAISGTLTASSMVAFQNSTNSTTAFQVQNASGATALNVDTQNRQLTINQQVIVTGTNDTVTIGPEMVTDSSTFNVLPNWTTGGVGPTLYATHNGGPDNDWLMLSTDSPSITGQAYRLQITVSGVTAGYVRVMFGCAEFNVFASSTTTHILDSQCNYFPLSFMPYDNFDGTISAISLKAFNYGKALQVFKNSNGTTVLEIRSSGDNTYNTLIGLNAGRNITTGAYYNTVLGANALQNTTTGSYNTALGYQSLYNNTTGDSNTAIGAAALGNNTTGGSNTAIGTYSLSNNTTGSGSTALGYQSLYFNTTGSGNTAVGDLSLFWNTTGGSNTANGYSALYNNTTGSSNTANGTLALTNNTTGSSNTANGYISLLNNTTGYNNTANGASALYANTTGGNNTANGYQSLYNNTTGSSNTAIGTYALNNLKTLTGTISATASNGGNAQFTSVSTYGLIAGSTITISGTTSYNGSRTVASVDSGATFTISTAYSTADSSGSWATANTDGNTAMGYQAGSGGANYAAVGNSLFGYNAGSVLQTGANYNTLVGYSAGSGITNGAQNVLIGYNAGTNLTTGSNNVLIGQGVTAASATGSNQLQIGVGISGNLSTGTLAVKTTTNSTNAFQVQNATGGQLFNVDTTGGNITLNGLNSGETGAWQTNANALPAARGVHSSVVANGYVYVIGGYDGVTGSTTTVYYAKLNADGSTGAWQTNANALPAVRDQHSSVVANGYVYVMGGYDTSTQSTVYYAKLNADGSTGAWVTNTNALPAARYFHTSVVANGYVYVIGGSSDSDIQSTVYYAKLNADGSTGAWVTNTNALPAARYRHSSVVANGYVYVIGGDNGGAQSTVYYAKLNADGSTGAWVTNTNALSDVREYQSSVVTNGYVYVIGGYNSTPQSTVSYAKLNADGSTGAWATNTNALPAARDHHTSVVANGYVYLLGGSANGGATPLNTIYYASTSRIQMAGSLDLVGLSAQNLSDPGDSSQGSTGGSLTAGNTQIVGSLSVQGQSNFAQSVVISGTLTASSMVSFQNSTNSTTAFQVQNSSGISLLTADTSNLRLNVNGDVNIGSSTASRLFSDNFEGGGFDLWSEGTDPGSTSAPTVDTTTVHGGKYAAKFNMSSQWGNAGNNFTAQPTVYARTWVNYASGTGTPVLFWLHSSGGPSNWEVYVSGTQICIYADTAGGTQGCSSSGLFTTNTWHQVELEVAIGGSSTTGTTGLWLDGTQVITINGTAHNGTDNIDGLYIGVDPGDNTTTTYYIDDVSVDTVSNGTSSSLNVSDSLHVSGATSFSNIVQLQGGVIFSNNNNTPVEAYLRDNGLLRFAGTVNSDSLVVGGSGYVKSGTTTTLGNKDYSGGNIPLYVVGDRAGTQSADLFQVANYTSAFGGETTVLGVNSNGDISSKGLATSATAFQIQNAGGTGLFNVDTSGSVITVAGTTTTFATLTLTNAHFKITQTNPPTAGPTRCGAGNPSGSAIVTAGSTDTAGSFTITADSSSPTICLTTITFNKNYGSAPKAIVLTPTTAVGSATGAKAAQVSDSSFKDFTVKLTTNPSANEVNSFYYWVIE